MDDEGLDYIDHKMMNCIINQYNGGPVGLDTIAVSIGEATPFAYEHFKKIKE